MSGRLAEKVVWLTGSTGIGAATARLAAREGGRVFISALDAGDCADLAPVSCDLRDPEAAGRALAECLRRFGKLDALFHIAGISGRRFGDGPLDRCTDEGWNTVMESNLTTTFRVCRTALRHWLDAAQGGAIVTMSSALALAPSAEHFPTHAYAASKGAILSLTRSMAAYYAPRGIRVNALAPGLVATPMSTRAQADEPTMGYVKRRQPLSGGILAAQDIAEAAVFLMSDESRHITGQVLAVDGGWCVGG